MASLGVALERIVPQIVVDEVTAKHHRDLNETALKLRRAVHDWERLADGAPSSAPDTSTVEEQASRYRDFLKKRMKEVRALPALPYPKTDHRELVRQHWIAADRSTTPVADIGMP